MQLFLIAFSLFDLCAAAAAFNAVAQFSGRDVHRGWASQRLFAIAQFACWGLLLLSLWSTAAAWTLQPLLALLPLAWILAMGVLFAVIDFAEDGVFDFGRGPTPKS